MAGKVLAVKSPLLLGEGMRLLVFGFLKIRGIATPVCALVRNDRFV